LVTGRLQSAQPRYRSALSWQTQYHVAKL